MRLNQGMNGLHAIPVKWVHMSWANRPNVYVVLLQIVLAVSQLMWCKDLTTCLTSDDIIEQVKQAEQRCFQVTNICKMMLFNLLDRILTGWQNW